MPLSSALTMIRNRNSSIPQCVLWTGSGRFRYGEILRDNNLLNDVQSMLILGDALVLLIIKSAGTHFRIFLATRQIGLYI